MASLGLISGETAAGFRQTTIDLQDLSSAGFSEAEASLRRLTEANVESLEKQSLFESSIRAIEASVVAAKEEMKEVGGTTLPVLSESAKAAAAAQLALNESLAALNESMADAAEVASSWHTEIALSTEAVKRNEAAVPALVLSRREPQVPEFVVADYAGDFPPYMDRRC